MSEQTVQYKGKTIVWNDAVDPPTLMIDRKSIPVIRSGSGEYALYVTSLKPHMGFASLLDIAKNLVDAGMVVNGQRL